MPRLFVGNFDFEEQLSAIPMQGRSGAVRTVLSDLMASWLAVAQPEDWIWTPGGIPQFDRSGLSSLGHSEPRWVRDWSEVPNGPEVELVPWGWTQQLIHFGRSRDWSVLSPALEIVKQVNSRAFRWQLEHELRWDLPGSAILKTHAEVRAHLAKFGPQDAWILKANFGMAGRERWLGRGPDLPPVGRNWLEKRLKPSQPVVVEPWLDRIKEAGIQWEIPASGSPRCVGCTPLMCHSNGSYAGSGVVMSADEAASWEVAISETLKVALRVQSVGYFGPLGIDVMYYRMLDGNVRLRLLQDLNARWTMGRLALGWRRYITLDRSCWWRHGEIAAGNPCPPDFRVVPTSGRSWLEFNPLAFGIST